MVVRETGSDVVIVDLENHQIQKLPFSQNHVISALMNPTKNIVAIQCMKIYRLIVLFWLTTLPYHFIDKTCLKICNTETKGWSKSIDISSDNVLFLKWVNSEVFCYVTATSIYYWKTSGLLNIEPIYIWLLYSFFGVHILLENLLSTDACIAFLVKFCEKGF